MATVDRFCTHHRGRGLRYEMRTPSKLHACKAVAIFTVLVLTNCTTQQELPSPNLDERNRTLAQASEMIDIISRADASSAADLLEHSDYRVRRAAALRLMDLGTDAISEIPRLVKALDDDHPRVQTAAARALGSIGDESAIEPLITNIADENRKVRLWTWKALVQLGDPAIEALITHMGKNTPTRALSYVNEAGNKISLLIEIRKRMPSFGIRAVPALVVGLESEDPWTRTNSANILGEIGPPAKEAIQALVIALDDDYGDCRFRAVEALGKIGDLDPMVMPALDRASKDKSKKIANRAKHAIKTIKAEQAKKKEKKKAKKKRKKKAKQKVKKKAKKKGKP